MTYDGQERRLTPRETDVVAGLAAGMTCPGIAEDLGMSRHTVEDHIQHIFAKLPSHYRGYKPQRAILLWVYETRLS